MSSKLYKALLKVIPEIGTPKDNGKSKVDGFMDFNFDLLNNEKDLVVFALSHYYKQNGDMIADPDMVVVLNKRTKIVKAVTYQDTYMYQEIDIKNPDNKLQKDLNAFLSQWLKNLHEQGHIINF